MHNRKRRRVRIAAIRFPTVFKGLGMLLLLFIFLRMIISFGGDAAAEDILCKLVSKNGMACQILSFELGDYTDNSRNPQNIDLSAVLSESSVLRANTGPVTEISEAAAPSETAAPAETDTLVDEDSDSLNDPEPFESEGADSTPASDSDIVETTITGGDSPLYINAEGIYLKNKTDYDIDVEALLNENLNFTIDLDQPSVLVIHTHGSEAFLPAGDDLYEESDPSRTEDTKYNVVRVGDELTEALEARGISVVHDRSLYDYPSYSGSYSRSLEAIENYLEEYPSIKIVIDLHRDALVASDGTTYKTVAQIEGQMCSQVMLVMGSNASGLQHNNWRENLKLALRLQHSMNERYPTLARPICLSRNRYNQHATTGSLLLEVGCNGNTLQEALTAIHLFADVAGSVILELAG